MSSIYEVKNSKIKFLFIKILFNSKEAEFEIVDIIMIFKIRIS